MRTLLLVCAIACGVVLITLLSEASKRLDLPFASDTIGARP